MYKLLLKDNETKQAIINELVSLNDFTNKYEEVLNSDSLEIRHQNCIKAILFIICLNECKVLDNERIFYIKPDGDSIVSSDRYNSYVRWHRDEIVESTGSLSRIYPVGAKYERHQFLGSLNNYAEHLDDIPVRILYNEM